MSYPLLPSTKVNSVLDDVSFVTLLGYVAERMNFVSPAYTAGLSLPLKLNSLQDHVTMDVLAAYLLNYQASVPTYTPELFADAITSVERTNSTQDSVSIGHLAEYLLKGLRLPRANVPVILNAAVSTTGWTANSGAILATKAFPVPHPDGSTTGLSITCAAADTFASARTTSLPANFHLADALLAGLWVYWSGTQGSIALRFTSDNFVSKHKTFSWAWSSVLHQGWNLLRIRSAADGTLEPLGSTWTTVGAFTDAEVVNGIEVQVNTNGGAQTEIFIKDIHYHVTTPQKGAVVFGFDAYGEASIVNLALPLFQAAGIKGYWAGDANLIDGNTNARNYLRTVYDAGWDTPTQGKLHPDYTLAPNLAVLGSDIDYARDVMTAQGFTRSLDQFSYPLSKNDAATDAVLVSKGIRIARSGWSWRVIPNLYNGGPKLIGHGAINIGGFSRTQMLNLVQAAKIYGSSIFPFTHEVQAGGDGVAVPGNSNYVFANDLNAMLQSAATERNAGNIVTPNISEWMRMYHY